MELQGVVSALARDAGVAVKTRTQTTKPTSLGDPVPSAVAIFARQPATLARYTDELGWKQPVNNNVSVWTDDYSNILGAIWRKYLK
jgi:hypothetical protein